VTDFDEKTRVTQVIQGKPDDEPAETGNDCLVVIYTKEPALLGKRFVLDSGRVRVGRGADNAIVLEGDSVSRQHASFERKGGLWYVIDDGSTNGTYVNEKQIVREAELNTNDRIKVGPTILKYLSGADAEAKYHEEIYRMTIVDGLTQIHNKRYLFESLEREIIRARRHDRPLSALMFDIDFFKRINDHYGHLAGDYVLRELAEVVQARIRRDEVFARYGGEEFVIVLPETPLDGAQSLAESIRARVAEHRFVFQGEQIPVTISIGSALVGEGDTATELIQRADEKLYEAKRGGRNKVC
jgi:diguanylate cyclase (GGDEF)-like protein